MNEIEEYYSNKARIEAIKDILINCGLMYDDRHKWYNPDGIHLRKDQQDYFKLAAPLFDQLVARNNELKKKFNIEV